MDPLRAKALELSKGLGATAKNIERIAGEAGPEAARWAFSQWTLRERAKAKFKRAAEMLFDGPGLEMATHAFVSGFVHQWYMPMDCTVADLTCGIGGDLIALAASRPAIGIETDAERASYARHNLEVHGRGAEVRVADCLDTPWNFECAFADPARRSAGRRTLDPKQFSPRLDELVPAMAKLRFGWIKLSPMLSDEFLDRLSPDRVFVNHEGECKEVLVAVGQGQRKHECLRGKWCLVAESNTLMPADSPPTAVVEEPLEYVYEAHAAAIRAHSLGWYGVPVLGDSNGYLTSDTIPSGKRVGVYRVHWHGPYHEKDIRLALAGTGMKVAVVKCRGASLEVDKVRDKLKTNGKKAVVLLVYPVGKSLRAVLAEKVR